jgi:hypothetical protein
MTPKVDLKARWAASCVWEARVLRAAVQPVRLAYQPPANSTFLSQQISTSNQPAVLFSQNKSAPAISHQPNEQAGGWEAAGTGEWATE